MKIYTCGCFFVYYNYLMQCRVDVGQTFTFSKQDFYVQVCHTCFFSLLKAIKFDLNHVNDRLKRICLFYLSESTISRHHVHARTCFEMSQIYLRADECEPNKAMTICCFRCLKMIVCYILSDLYCV